MTFQIRKAERKQSKLRIGLSGPAGSGKTYSALLIARGLVDSWEQVGLIDTENGRGDLYSDLGPYNIIRLEAPFTPERYIEALDVMEKAGMLAIVIDSISHEWEGKGGCLEINDQIANHKFKGNTWSAWSETTPRHRNFIEKIISMRTHVISTVRNKVDSVMEGNKVKKVGTKDLTRDGFDYEMTVFFNIDHGSHTALATKDNTRIFEKVDPFVITQKTGELLRAWNQSGNEGEVARSEIVEPPKPAPAAPVQASAAPVAVQKPVTPPQDLLKVKLMNMCKSRVPALSTKEEYEEAVSVWTKLELKEENYQMIVDELTKLQDMERTTIKNLMSNRNPLLKTDAEFYREIQKETGLVFKIENYQNIITKLREFEPTGAKKRMADAIKASQEQTAETGKSV
jgi:hypothetical protein